MKLKIVLLLCLFGWGAKAQNDCVDAITVCGNMGYQGLTATGIGTQELLNNNNCGSFENNSLWLKLSINTGGTLGFTLIPGSSNIVIDFDFFIFGPNVTCGDLGQAIRCSTTNPQASGAPNNHTGMNETSADTSEGPGEFGDNFLQWLTVEDGDTYYLVIDRPIGSSEFSIVWTGTATFHEAPVYNNVDEISLDLAQCDSDNADDQTTLFDLTTHADMLLGNQQFITLTYHENQNDVITGDNPIANPEAYANTGIQQTIYMRMTNTTTGCFEIQSFNIEVTNPVVAGEPEDLALCDLYGDGHRDFELTDNDELIRNGAQNTSVTYYLTATDAQNEVNPLESPFRNPVANQPQTIWARLENISGCYGHDIVSFTINIVPEPDIVYTLDVVDFNGAGNSITVEMANTENYEFSIDGTNFSDNPSFTGLEPGPYTVYIRSKSGCRFASEDLVLLDYPKFFTPNGDGHNETWRIPYLNLQPRAMVTIYDRYGKIITAFKGGFPGWDGTFNNYKLPATDYWFVLQLDNDRIIKGHFAMVR